MILKFREKMISILDGYNVFDENDNICYTVKGKIYFGHSFEIFDKDGKKLGSLKEQIVSFLPHYYIYLKDEKVGLIAKTFSLFRPKFKIDLCGWQVEGDFGKWNYKIFDNEKKVIATISKKLFDVSETYILNIPNEKDALLVVMTVLAIDSINNKEENR